MVYCVFAGAYKDKRLLRISEEFHQRLERLWPVTLVEIPKTEKAVLKFVEGKKGKGLLVSLDPHGQSMTSVDFGRWVTQSAQDIYFFVWDVDGPPTGISMAKSLSLSPMTYSHELARVLLMEQLYRAGAALRGHPYSH